MPPPLGTLLGPGTSILLIPCTTEALAFAVYVVACSRDEIQCVAAGSADSERLPLVGAGVHAHWPIGLPNLVNWSTWFIILIWLIVLIVV